MAYRTGDILVNTRGPGHAAMIYRGDGDTGMMVGFTPVQIIHAQSKTHFHVSTYNPTWPKTWHFSPSTPLTDEQQAMLRKVADVIKEKAEYGVGRMITRLPFTKSKWSDDAAGRVKKYGDRLDQYFMESHLEMSGSGFQPHSQGNKASMKVVSKVTCAEAVLLCYQLMVRDPIMPLFPKLNARGTMPSALATYLRTNGSWTIKHDPARG